MAMTLDTKPTTRLAESSGTVVESDSNSFIIAAIILASILVCVFIAMVAYSYCGRRRIPDCCQRVCPCLKQDPVNIEMGYLPAHITVNSTAVEQGVPDIFLRHSTSGRISMDPASCEVSRESHSVETSGAWADYLRRATLRRSSLGNRLMEKLKDEGNENEETRNSTSASQEGASTGLSQSTSVS